ncbi:two-component system sensor histidine kinase NtrB [Archaeoglobus veneficus]|uniref:PAS/PAC sensor signal transduction histidine kinase n=1 Tax=Archaeoglobus veneficus (strain DSM 11195 / SNP6) TaxID=693661 RepID=F2KPI2_ARCVS|nr:PAS domain-containing sensor histidine kinase [Archaeoglobus veneficus]AEA46413.1 PAS/PAC sensor signal transduction histidine kinase [Archaeoglobus veneficus SNP6]
MVVVMAEEAAEEDAFCIVDSFLDAIVEVDSEGRVTFWNRAAERMFGYTQDEAAGRPIWELIVPEKYVEANKRGFKHFRRTGDGPVIGKTVRLEAKRKDGSVFPIELSVSRRYVNGEWRAVAVVRDVSDKVEAERKINELNKHLRILNSLLRHDIKNALTTAKLCLDLLRDYAPDELAERLEKQLEKAFDIIEDVKHVELMLNSGELHPVNIGEVVREQAAIFGIECKVPDVYVEADSALKSVVFNLIHNAFIHNDNVNVEISLRRNGKWVELRIADDGKGIPDELKQIVFEEGFKGETGRTGLGLYLVKETVKRYGGEVWVEDNKPKGSVFVIRLRTCQ